MKDKKKAAGFLIEWGIPLLLSFAFFILPLLIISPVYALNDDLQLRDILSGAASGRPDFHTVYMRAPLAMLLAGLYTILPSLPWLGILECGAVVLCGFIMLRSVQKKSLVNGWPYAVGLLLFTAFYLLMLREIFILPHYTLVAALCGGCGIWCLLDMGSGAEGMGSLRNPSKIELFLPIFLLLLCEQIRSQVFLMVLPFAVLALVYILLTRFGWEKRKEWKKSIKPLLIFCGAYIVLLLIHVAAYTPWEWKDYLALNDARTELYDYTGIWESDEAKAYYAGYGVDENSFPLYRDYDLLPVSDARTERLKTLAAWREPGRSLSGAERFKNVLWELRKRSFGGDLYGIPLLLIYLLALLKHLKKEQRKGLLPLAAAFLLHFAFYGYLLWNGRTPERVTDSLYLIQFLFLSHVLLKDLRKGSVRSLLWPSLACIVFFIASFFTHPGEYYVKQSAVNHRQDVVYSYMAERPDSLFLLETYATVDRTEKVATAKGAENALLLGGWLYGSPLQDAKLKSFGYESREELFTRSGAYVVFREGAGLEPGELTSYLEAYYPDGARLEPVTMLMGGEDVFLIFMLSK